jgi:allophanate hydrolase
MHPRRTHQAAQYLCFCMEKTMPAPLNFEQIDLTISGLRAHYQRGDFAPRALIDLLRSRNIQFGDRNIWIYMLSETELSPYIEALATRSPADAPLYGVPFAIKDNIDLAHIPTTAACSAFSYIPREHAPVVAALIAAGAIPLGKTNLDQFATGLVGTRSPVPWGACGNSFDPDYIAGGSSSGSAVAVALGVASFALGTDTAGSGRIPAAFNNIVGLKPSRGLLSTRGMVPACRSLDCVSLFATTAQDLRELFAIAARFDGEDGYARRNPAHNGPTTFGMPAAAPFEFGVPRREQLRFFGNELYATAFAKTVAMLERLGGRARTIDLAPFLDAASLLYEGPWVAERYHALQALLQVEPTALLPVTAGIVGAGRDKSAVAAFDAMYRLQDLRRAIEPLLEAVDFIVTPTAGTHFTQAQIAAQPIAHNSELGYYTNFMNLLDLSAVAVPAAMLANGMPFGITLFADHFRDMHLLSHAHRLQCALDLPLGATGKRTEFAEVPPRSDVAMVDVVVCGAHMAGLPLNTQLVERGAKLIAATQTAPHYRLYALAGGAIPRPGLVRDETGGAPIAVEVWRLPTGEFGSLVTAIPRPLGIGSIEMHDGRWLPGFLCEQYALGEATEISALGGWRAYITSIPTIDR